MSEITLERYQQLVEGQSRALLDAIQSVAQGNLDVEVEIPEGIEALSELAVGIGTMVDDLREMMLEQERARVEIESSRQQVEAALQEIMDAQRRDVRQAWEAYAADPEASSGYRLAGIEQGPAEDAWLPAMTPAVQQQGTITEHDPEHGAMLAIPIRLYGEVIGALGFSREDEAEWPQSLVMAAEAIAEQVAWTLENQRLFDEEQAARALLDMRVSELDCLNDIGRELDQTPRIPALLPWVADRIPSAMRFPELCVAAIQFDGVLYGAPEAVELPSQMVQSLDVGGKSVGRVYVAYREERDFVDEERALLGDIARRVSGYIENRRLLQETQEAARELGEERTLLRTLIDNIPDLIYTKDAESRFLINNAAHLRSLGVTSQEEVLGKTDLDIFPSELAEQYYADEQEIFRSGQPLRDREEPVVDQTTGERTWVLTTKVPLRDSLGRVVGLVGVGRDITDRKRAEEVLERRRAQLECLSDVGQRIGESPPVPEFLQWVAERIPSAMQFPELCATAISFNGELYGAAQARELPHHIVHGLHIADERVGRIHIAYTEDRGFLDEESALLGDIARRVSGYVENQRLLEETQSRAEEQATLRRITQTVSRSLEMQELLDTSLDTVLASMDFDAALVSLTDERTSELVLAAHRALPEAMVRKFEQDGLGGTLCDYVLQTGETLGISDLSHETRVDVSGLLKQGFHTYAGALLSYRGERAGTVCCFGRSPRALTPQEISLLQGIGDQIAVGIANARLFQETQFRAERERLVRTITDRVRGAVDAESIMRVGLEELSRVLGTSQLVIRLGSREQLISGPFQLVGEDAGDGQDAGGNGANGQGE